MPITVGSTTKLNEIFPEGIPVNAFIDKGRCAIGATYHEITYKNRCTIITVPNISIILSKKIVHPEMDIVYCNVSDRAIADMFKMPKTGQKIMTTPEGLSRIIKAAKDAGRLPEVYKDWFLLLDEGHTYISEMYRDNILKPFDYFPNFKQKSIISATPYVFSDPRIQFLDHIQINFTASLNKVNLINAVSVEGALDYFIKNRHRFPGNLHIFYNSVNEIGGTIRRTGIDDCSIFCSDDEKKANRKKLGDLWQFFCPEPQTGKYSKVNFYTCKYFEGWDLYDKDATVIFVTNVTKSHTRVGVRTKGKQAIGRLREDATKGSSLHQIIHITNHERRKEMKPLETFRTEYIDEANLLIKQNEERVMLYKQQGRKHIDDDRLLHFADINEETKLATLNYMKLDQQINEAANSEIYNHISYVEKDWQDAYFEVNRFYSDERIETSTKVKRKSAATLLQEDYYKIKSYKLRQQDSMCYIIGATPEQEIKANNPLAYKAELYLDEATVEGLKFNVKKVEAAIILKENTLSEVKLLKLIGQSFKIGARYSNEDIKSRLYEIYAMLNIREENGKIKTATAKQLTERGWFEIRDCKVPSDSGKPVNGQVIIRAKFSLRMAA